MESTFLSRVNQIFVDNSIFQWIIDLCLCGSFQLSAFWGAFEQFLLGILRFATCDEFIAELIEPNTTLRES